MRWWGARRVGGAGVALVVVLAVGAVLGPAAGAGTGAGADKAPTVHREVVGRVAPDNAPGQSLILERVVVDPGAEAAVHFHEGTQLVTVRSGAIRYRVTAGSAAITRQDGTTETLDAPGTTRLRAGDVFVERASTVHGFVNPTGRAAVLELAALLDAGAPLSTPLDATGAADTRLQFATKLTSQNRSLFTVGPDGIDTFGWNRLSGTTTIDGETVTLDFLTNVDYERGSGPFFGFFVLTFPDGATLGVSLQGTATSMSGGTDTSFAAALEVIGGTGRLVDQVGSGLFTGFRRAALGGTVDLDVVLTLRPRSAASPS